MFADTNIHSQIFVIVFEIQTGYIIGNTEIISSIFLLIDLDLCNLISYTQYPVINDFSR
jgi:hypothetical protein